MKLKLPYSLAVAVGSALIVAGVCVLHGVGVGLIGSGVAVLLVTLVIFIERNKDEKL